MSPFPVRLTHYDPKWRQEFEQTRSSIFLCSEGWVTNVFHIGSTAVSGLIARPTVDVVATVGLEEHISGVVDLIAGLNYRPVATPLWADGATTMIKPRQESSESPNISHRVFLVVHVPETNESSALVRAVQIRNHLRANPETALELEEIKVNAWKLHQGDWAAYHDAKATFFSELQDRIDLEGGDRF